MTADPIYLLETNFAGEPLIPEHRTAELTLANAIAAVADGDDIRRVLRIDPDGTWKDATHEVAQAIADNMWEQPSTSVQEFLEHTFGCRRVADMLRELEGV